MKELTISSAYTCAERTDRMELRANCPVQLDPVIVTW